MKKGFCCLLAALSTVGLCACGGNGGAAEAKIELTYGEKYIYKNTIKENEEAQVYFIFNKDGTAEYYYYGIYTMDLIYTEVPEENMIYCFYNGFSYQKEGWSASDSASKTAYSMMCSENVVRLSNGEVYILESYLDEIPKFGE